MQRADGRHPGARCQATLGFGRASGPLCHPVLTLVQNQAAQGGLGAWLGPLGPLVPVQEFTRFKRSHWE